MLAGHCRSLLAFVLLTIVGCRGGEESRPPPAVAPAAAPAPVAAATVEPADAASSTAEPRAAAAGSDAGAPSSASDAGVVASERPKVCAAASPADETPCTGYGGTYRIVLRPRPDAKEKCLVKKPVEAKVTLDASAEYRGKGQARELEGLSRALGLVKPELRVGAAVRDGVCCVDLDLSDGTDRTRRVRVHVARGDKKVSAKAAERTTGPKQWCDADLDVEAELAAR